MTSTSRRAAGLWALVLGLASSNVVAAPGTGPTTGSREFRVVQDDGGRYWFQSPAGDRFLSLAVNNVNPYAHQPRPGTVYYDPVRRSFSGDEKAWIAWTANLLHGAGFNTFGSWSLPALEGNGIYHTPCLYVAGHATDRCLAAFQPDFEQTVRRNVAEALRRFSDTSMILGVFLDNEMPWCGQSAWTNNPTYTLLEAALDLTTTHPARVAGVEFLRSKYREPAGLAAAWALDPQTTWEGLTIDSLRKGRTEKAASDRAEFTALAARRFFEPSVRIVREMLPGSLILGVRFAGPPPDPVTRVCGEFCDIVSINNYQASGRVNQGMMARQWMLAGKPLMVTEYSWRAAENTSGNPNTRGAGTVLKTQKDRAAKYEQYVADLLSYPMIVGAHWFEFADQSPQGRFDGEDSNYGIVDIENRPYSELLAAMTKTNKLAAQLHATSDRKIPTEIPPDPKAKFEPGQYPNRPPAVDLLSGEPSKPFDLFNAGDAKIQLSREGQTLVVTCATGEDWGCGINVYGPRSNRTAAGPSFATDLDGYTEIAIEAELPKGKTFNLFIDEAGVQLGPDGTHNSGAGDDGESYQWKPQTGTGEKQTYVVDIGSMSLRKEFGNQDGGNRIDTQGLKGPAIYFPGAQGEFTAKIHSVQFRR